MRRVIKSNDPKASSLLGYAETKHYSLSSIRKSAGVAVLQKRIYVGDFMVELYSSDWDNYIRISGGGSIFDVVFASGDTLYGYSTESGQFGPKLSYGTDAHLNQLYPKHITTNKNASVFSATNKISYKRSGDTGIVGHLPGYSGAILVSGTTMSWVDGHGVFPLGSLPTQTYDEVVAQGPFAMASFVEQASSWNTLNGPHAYQIPPLHIAGSLYKWSWQPRISYPDKLNLFYAAGLWYGAVSYRLYGPSRDIHVQFGCLLDGRYGSQNGYVEVLRHVGAHGINPTDEDYLEAWFTLSFYDVGRASFIDADSAGQRFLHNSVFEAQQAPAFTIDYSGNFNLSVEKLELSFWSSALPLPDPEDEDPPIPTGNYGVVAVDPAGNFVVHAHRRYVTTSGDSGITVTLKSGSGYIGHSYSSDGSVFVIFTAEGGVFVYDLVKKKTIRDTTSPIVLDSHFQSVVVVPTTTENTYTDVVNVDDEGNASLETAPAIVEDSTFNNEMNPCLGGVTQYWQPANQGSSTSGWKVVCKDGVNAYGVYWTDGCWEWEISRIRPADSQNLDREHSVKVSGETYMADSFFGLTSILPYMLGSIEGQGANFQEILLAKWDDSKNYPQAISLSSGSNTNVDTISRADVGLQFGFGLSSGGPDYYTPSDNATAPYSWTSAKGSLVQANKGPSGDYDLPVDGETDKVIFIPDTPICNDGTGNVRFTDSCGMSASADVELLGPPRLSITVQDGDIQVSGGMPPYNLSSSCGSIDPDTGEIDTTGCCGTGSVSVTDDCGNNATTDYVFPDGQWVLAGCLPEDGYTCGQHLNCWTVQTIVTGGLRIEITYADVTASLGGSCPTEAPPNTIETSSISGGTVEGFADPGFTGDCCPFTRKAWTRTFTWECL